MSPSMHPDELPLEHQILTDRNIALKLVGVGGAGSNAIDRLKMDNLDRVQLAVVNTDFQALSTSPCAGEDPDRLGGDARPRRRR